MTSFKELLTLRGYTEGIGSVAFSPDGEMLATASYDKTVRLWRAPRPKSPLNDKPK